MRKFRANSCSLRTTSVVASALLAALAGCARARQSAPTSGAVVQVSTADSLTPAASVSTSPAIIVVPAGALGPMGPPGAAGAAGAPGLTGPAGPPGTSAQSPIIVGCTGCPTTAGGTSPSAITLTFGDLRGLVESAARVEEIWGEVKFILPVLIPVIAALGAFYIRTQSEKLQQTIESRFTTEIDTEKARFDQRFKEIEEKLTAGIQASDAKMNFQGAGLRYKLALYAWNNRDFVDAIYQASVALEHADHAIALFESLNKSVVGDLAYYYADAYKANGQIDNGTHAVQFARRLLSEWSIFKDEIPLNLVDTYLYVLATVRAIPQEEIDSGRALWSNYKRRLPDFLRAENQKMADEHIALFDEVFGTV